MRRGVIGSAPVDPGNFDAESFAKVNGCFINALIGCGGPQVQLVTLGPAPEATIRVFGEINRKRATSRGSRSVDRTSSPHLVATRAGRDKIEQFQNLPDRNLGAQCLKINAWHSHLLRNREEQPVHPEAL
jgi:hypothetical protein